MWVRTSVHPTSGHNFFHSDAHKLTAHLPPNTVPKLQSTTTRQDRSWRGNVLSFMIVHKEEAEKEERTGVSGECRDQWAVDLDSNTETILWQMSSKAIWLFEHIHARKKKRSDPVVKLAWVTSRCWWTNNRTTTNTHKKIWCDSNVLEFSLLRWLPDHQKKWRTKTFWGLNVVGNMCDDASTRPDVIHNRTELFTDTLMQKPSMLRLYDFCPDNTLVNLSLKELQLQPALANRDVFSVRK